MSRIAIRRGHGMTLQKAKAAAARVAAELHSDYELTTSWSGNTLSFEKVGLAGTLRLSANALELDLELGFMFALLRPQIEARLLEELDRVFGESPC